MLILAGFSDITPLDRGGFGSVYRATRTSTGGTVALKQLDQAHGVDEELLERRLRREIAALVALKGHPNVVQVEEMIVASGGPVIVMEFMDAGSVGKMIDATSRSPEQLAYVGSCVAFGLAAAHEAGIVHRDVKPQNVLLNNFGQVKLCDFGIAAILKSAENQTRTTSLSVRYASPEELDNDPDVGPPTDVFSLGAAMYHLLYGAPPSFRNRGTPDVDATIVRRGNGRAHAMLCQIVEECLHPQAASRPTASEVYDMLAGLADTGPTVSRSASASPDQEEDRDRTAPRVRSSSSLASPSPLASPTPPVAVIPPEPGQSTPPLPQSADKGWWR